MIAVTAYAYLVSKHGDRQEEGQRIQREVARACKEQGSKGNIA